METSKGTQDIETDETPGENRNKTIRVAMGEPGSVKERQTRAAVRLTMPGPGVRKEPYRQLAMIFAVLVDVVAPGKALVTSEHWSGQIVRDTEHASGYVVETEDGRRVGRAKSYREGALRLVRHHGHAPAEARVEIDHERSTVGDRDIPAERSASADHRWAGR